MNIKRGMRVTRAGLIVLIALTLSSGSAVAQEGWDFTAGGGVYRDNVYPGSSDYYVVPVPIAGATYETGNFSYYISILNGAGVSWFSEETGLSASASVKYGEERDSEEYSLLGIMKDHSDRTKRLLADTPTASAPAVYDATIGYQALNGTIGFSVEYYPTSLDYKLAGQEDKDYHGLISSLFYSIEGPVAEKLLASAMVGVEHMNQGYAEAWYTVGFPTSELNAFEAEAGLRSAMFSLQITRMFSEKAGLSLFGAGTWLVGDAGNSPYTKRRFQPSTLLLAFYNF